MREPRPSVDQHLPLHYQIKHKPQKKTLITATSNAEECFKFSGGKLPATARGLILPTARGIVHRTDFGRAASKGTGRASQDRPALWP